MLATTKKLISNTNPQLSVVLTWEQAVAAGPEVCGGKGYNLGRLHRYGFRIPRGGVIPAAWYNDVARALILLCPDSSGHSSAGSGRMPRRIGAWQAESPRHRFLETVRAEDVVDPAVTAALEGIRQAIETAELPPALVEGLAEFLDEQGLTNASVSVRSSATTEDSASASFAGIHRSSLNVRGIDEIARAILGCYDSLWTPQAVAYRRKMNFADDEVQCA